MIQDRKIDLALEAKELAEGSAAQTTRLAGVKAQEDTVFGYPLTRVEILNREGEAALGKPKGTYLTLELPQLPREREEVLRAARGVAAVLEALPTLPKQGSVLVAGLGNRHGVTPDAIGPRATDFLLVTPPPGADHAPGLLRPPPGLRAGRRGHRDHGDRERRAHRGGGEKAQARLPHRRGRPGRPPAGAGVPDGPGL